MTPWRDPRTGLAVYRPLIRRTALRTRSAKLAALQRTYTKMRADFLEANPWCARCGGESEQVHHRAGRGVNLLRVDTWLALCALCHTRVTERPAEAYENGWSVRRIGGAGT